MIHLQPLIQSLLAALIVLAAVGYAIWKLIKKTQALDRGCTGCTSGCADCSLADLKRGIKRAGKKNIQTPTHSRK